MHCVSIQGQLLPRAAYVTFCMTRLIQDSFKCSQQLQAIFLEYESRPKYAKMHCGLTFFAQKRGWEQLMMQLDIFFRIDRLIYLCLVATLQITLYHTYHQRISSINSVFINYTSPDTSMDILNTSKRTKSYSRTSEEVPSWAIDPKCHNRTRTETSWIRTWLPTLHWDLKVDRHSECQSKIVPLGLS